MSRQQALRAYCSNIYTVQTGYNLQKLVQGDDIAMSCIASKYKYHKVTWYKRNSRTNETSVFERSDAVEYRKTEFSHVGVITFERWVMEFLTFRYKNSLHLKIK